MSELVAKLVDLVLTGIENQAPEKLTPEDIRNYVRAMSPTLVLMKNPQPTEDDVEGAAREIETRIAVTMEQGTLFYDEEQFRPWLHEKQGDIDWYYWRRYRGHLRRSAFGPQVLRSMDSITDTILDHLGNPCGAGTSKRKGMVVGHVQSGKTANYTGLICKAADSGYRFIIVLAGMLNSLRDQTQVRIDEGFIGVDSSLVLDDVDAREKLAGVGLRDSSRQPWSFTTRSKDFNQRLASQVIGRLADFKEPAVVVIKKHTRSLNSLARWLENDKTSLKQPMLMIDDEADQASINTKKSVDEVTAINKGVRRVLNLFERSAYVGYTATPFANIFIDPDSKTDMLGDDLFPRDFILTLDPPSNYFGPEKVFLSGREDGGGATRVIEDSENLIPLRHKIDLVPGSLPESLQQAIRCFLLCRTVRILRGETGKHHSMMVNVSRFTNVQTQLRYLIEDYLKELQDSVGSHHASPVATALRDSGMAALRKTWEREYAQAGFEWEEVQRALSSSSTVKVVEVNSSSNAEPLDYSARNFPSGRSVIAVGGLSLSRGLTLEGLTISYFLRNSVMYDTLMQMGRWFGYRDGYGDLVRVFMPQDAISWYQHISEATEELREEFRRMKRAGMTPKDFGLCVRSHPESLIVTARNKMRTGKKVTRTISPVGRLIETTTVVTREETLRNNRNALERMVKAAARNGDKVGIASGHYWRDVPKEDVVEFILGFENHPFSQKSESKPIASFIKAYSQGQGRWDVNLVDIDPERRQTEERRKLKELGFPDREDICGVEIHGQARSFPTPDLRGMRLTFAKHRVASRGAEKVGLPEETIARIQEEYRGSDKKNVPDLEYRKARSKPLLMLHMIRCIPQEDGPVAEGLTAVTVVAWGISFPGEAGAAPPGDGIEYVVNTVYWNNEYQDYLEDDSDLPPEAASDEGDQARAGEPEESTVATHDSEGQVNPSARPGADG